MLTGLLTDQRFCICNGAANVGMKGDETKLG
jgi:hypothetical protein